MNQAANPSQKPGALDQPARSVVPWLVLTAMLLLTALAALTVANNIQTKDRLRFRNSVQNSIREIRDAINARIDKYVALLRGTAGLYAADGQVDRSTFAAYVDRLDLSHNYQGVQGIGFARMLLPQDREGFVTNMRKSGLENYSVWPDGSRDVYSAVEFIEPQEQRNRQALGYDMYSDSVRREAMNRARDSGSPQASGRVDLVQEIDGQPHQTGFLIYVPVYRGQPTTIEQRRRDLIGFVYSPFRSDDLLKGIGDSDEDSTVEYSVYDGPETAGEQLLHRSGASIAASHHIEELRPVTLDVAGRTWTLTFAARPQFGPSTGWGTGGAVLIGGSIMGLVLFLVTRAQVEARAAAEASTAELQRSQAAVRASEHRFRTLFEQSPLSIQVFAPDGSSLLANQAWSKLWNADVSNLRGYNILNDPQLEARGHTDHVRRAFAGEAVMLPPMRYDPAEIGRAGRVRWVQCNLYPVTDESGVREVVLIHQDVTDTIDAEEERARLLAAERNARAEAESANRTKDEFLATLSHELRTPLNAILGWAQLLRMDAVEGEDRAHALETIERNAKAQAQLVEDLLDLSRIISGKLRLDLQKVDLPIVVEAAVDSVRPTAEAKGVRLIPILDAHATPILGDSQRLQQVVWNLLTNAVKFTPKGGTVQVFLQKIDSHAEIVVSDSGQGIAANFLPYVFDRLRQADSSSTRTHGGLGLGLAIVRHLVELHGGTVEAESRGEGKGAAFTVTLPIADPRRVAARKPAITSDGTTVVPSSGALAGVRVLVVDDEPDARDLISHILRRSGASVSAASSAQEAVAAMPQFHPHILVSDISMPGEDGYSLIRQVRSLHEAQGGRIPAVALTALARKEDRRSALLAGFQMHLAKPVEPNELTTAVANLVKAL
jgi:PAS domain S-box-containing protein